MNGLGWYVGCWLGRSGKHCPEQWRHSILACGHWCVLTLHVGDHNTIRKSAGLNDYMFLSFKCYYYYYCLETLLVVRISWPITLTNFLETRTRAHTIAGVWGIYYVVHKQLFHATIDRQHNVTVLLLFSYLGMYTQSPTGNESHHEFRQWELHTFSKRAKLYFKSFTNSTLDRIVRATQNRLWVSGGSSVASLNAIFCCLVHHTHTVQTHTHTHTYTHTYIRCWCSATLFELTKQGRIVDARRYISKHTSIHHRRTIPSPSPRRRHTHTHLAAKLFHFDHWS